MRDYAERTGLDFEPEAGTLVRRAPGEGPGYWAGAPGATFDDGAFYVAYRLRRPRGVRPDRGAEVRIARGTDGFAFEDIWKGTKDALDTTSIERCALRREADGLWALFLSYVDPADGRWRIDRVEAGRPDGFDLTTARRVLTAAEVDGGVVGVKDPYLFRVAGLDHMIVSVALATGPAGAEELHGTHDAYNTGLIRSATGLATSDDGRSWRWEGLVLEPGGAGWDRYCTRIGCLWYESPVWLALYDGSGSVSENYEERCGLAFAHDLRRFHRASRSAPRAASPHGSGALRYFDLLERPDGRYLYYEMAAPDGGHDLRVVRLPPRGSAVSS